MYSHARKRSFRHSCAILAFLFCAIFISGTCQIALAGDAPDISADTATAQPEKRVVRVGYPAQIGLTEVDENGNHSGYTYEYLESLAQFTGWEYEFITPEGTLDEQLMTLLGMLSSGEIDLLGCVVRSDAMETMYQYPSLSYGTGYTNLAAPIYNTALNEVTFPTYAKDGIRVGAPAAGATRQAQLEAFCQMNGYKYELVTYENASEMEQLFADDKIDVCLSSDLSCGDALRTVAYFSGVPFYFISTLGNTGLMDELDEGITQLEQSEPAIQLTLHQKYFRNDNYGFFITGEEQAYLDSAHTIRVLAGGENIPFQHICSNGEYQGISVDILDRLAEQTGLRFEYVNYDPSMPLAEQIAANDIQIVMGVRQDYEYARKNGLILGTPIVNTELTVFSNSDISLDNVSNLKIAVQSDTSIISMFRDATPVYCSTTSQCIDMVASGEADFGYGNSYTVGYYTTQHSLPSFTTVGIPGESINICFAFTTPADTSLITLANRMVSSLSSNEIYTAIMNELSRHQSEKTLVDYIVDHPFRAIAICVALLLVIFAVIMYMVQSRNKQKLYESHNKSKSMFLAKMSHEIRTPLNAVIGYLTIAQMPDSTPEKIQHCLENGELAAKHLLSIINDVLDMSAIESNRIKIAHEDYNLKQQISTISTIFYNQANNRNVHFETRISGMTQEWVVGDQLRVNQVIMNLLSNAVKFTPENGDVKLVVEQLEAKGESTRFRFTVSDTGIGMSEDFLARMFTPFEQESATTAQKYGGTGLGLSISHNLVTLMGGTLNVQSVQNKGTTFVVELPFGYSKENEVVRKDDSVDYSRIHALIVDDERSECEYVKQLLDRCGVKSTMVQSGKDALRKIRSRMNTDFAYDICIMDWNMPECNGLETARLIREQCAANIPIIIVTAYDTGAIEDDAHKAGVDKVISKPVFQSTMFDLLLKQFGKYKPAVIKGAGDVDLKGLRILLAEDNEMNMEIATDILNKLEVIIEPAVNGKEAFDKFTASAPGYYDCILMDIQMPVMDGYAATKAIRASSHPNAATVPIIAMTANAFSDDVAESLRCGMNDHISKPVEYAKLVRAVSKFTSKVENKDA